MSAEAADSPEFRGPEIQEPEIREPEIRDPEIREVDPFDAEAVDAWHAAYLAADLHGRTSPAPYQLEEMRAELQAREKGRRVRAFTLSSGDVVVSSGFLDLPLLDSLTSAWLRVHTRPEASGRGHGTFLLRHLEEVARAEGRTVLSLEAAWSHDLPADGTAVPTVEWLARRGYRLGLVDVQRELRLPLPPGLLVSLADEAREHHAAYTLQSWAGPVPDELLDGYLALSGSLPVEAPVGDLHLEHETQDAEHFRDMERRVAEQGRVVFHTVALDAAGEVVAFTDLVVSSHDDNRGYQSGTMVRRADRGHRLGLAVKVANLALLQRDRPEVVRLTTFNADVNTAMIAVNERLGFRAVEWLGEFQKRA